MTRKKKIGKRSVRLLSRNQKIVIGILTFIIIASMFYFLLFPLIPVSVDDKSADNGDVPFKREDLLEYTATYSFEQDINSEGISISFVENDKGNKLTTVIEEKDNHKSVLKISDEQNDKIIAIYNVFSKEIDSGTIEMWFYVEKADFLKLMNFNSEPPTEDAGFFMSIRDDKSLRIRQGGTGKDICSIDFGEWIHLSFEFDITGDDLSGKITINGENEYTINVNNMGLNSIRSMGIETCYTCDNTIAYYDAIGFTWEGYNVGDNLIGK